MVEYDTTVRRFDELESSNNLTRSGRNELNNHFIQVLANHQRRFGGGSCAKDEDHPVKDPVTLYLAAWKDKNVSVNTATVSLNEGDVATIGIDDSEYRIKFHGHHVSRPESENIWNHHAIAFSIDSWDEEEGMWTEREHHLGTTESREWTDGINGMTIRVAIGEAPGYDPERDFVNLISDGLSPAEAIDYWMVDIQNRSQQEWAETRGKTQQAISKNVRQGRSKLGKPSKE